MTLLEKLTNPAPPETPVFDRLFQEVDDRFDCWDVEERDRHWDMYTNTLPKETR